MKTRNGLKRIGIICVLWMLFIGGCNKTDGETIVWIIPDGVTEDEISYNVELVNEQLKNDGYSAHIEVKVLPSDTYRRQIIPYLTEGKVDIVSLSMDYADGSTGYAEDLVREGYFEELSIYLSSKEGEKLKQEYCAEEWKTVETDGVIYSVPNQTGMKSGSYVAFNKKYVSEELFSEFSGDIQELEVILDAINIPQGVYPVLGHLTLSDLAIMCKKQEDFGVFFDLETGLAENPYQNPNFCLCLKKLQSLYEKKYIGQMNRSAEMEEVENGNFVIWISNDYDCLYEDIKEKIYVRPLNFTMTSSLSLSTGINKNSVKKEAALQILTLVYTEEKYTNLLLYGEAGIDYQIVNGCVYDMQQQQVDAFRKNLMFGIYNHAYPCMMDDLIANREKKKEEMYTSEYLEDSILLGFQADLEKFDQSMLGLYRITEQYSNIWTADDFDAALQEAVFAFENAGGNKVVDELNRQISEWMQKTKQ